MRILVISQYFWPENFRINDLTLGLKERGHNVTVLTGRPNYPGGSFYEGYNFFNKRKEDFHGIKVIRSSLFPRGKSGGIRLFLNYLSFAFFASIKTLFLKKEYDLIFVYEPSPITVGIPAVFASKRLKIPVYFWVQDLWPESVVVAGQVKNKSVVKTLDKITRWIYKNSKYILIQSQGFKDYILNQDVEEEKIIYYPNSTEKIYDVVEPSEEILKIAPKVPFSILFAGNIGESQDFENILEAARMLLEKNDQIHFVILGDGRKKQFVEEKVKEYKLDYNFHLLGSFPVDTMPYFFATADGLLVSLKESEIFAMTIPSKVQSYLACGKPIIGSLNGEGAKVILDSKSGFIVPSGKSDLLVDAILKLYNLQLEDRADLGKNARKYFEENFEREMLLDSLLELFENR